mmetsp:Transcript_7131/g.44208  ORF Transcript_7131/g.44208 Transcript_7131/m.44208 type:complete len:223 (+) Transcript_7131:2578-3246(+)
MSILDGTSSRDGCGRKASFTALVAWVLGKTSACARPDAWNARRRCDVSAATPRRCAIATVDATSKWIVLSPTSSPPSPTRGPRGPRTPEIGSGDGPSLRSTVGRHDDRVLVAEKLRANLVHDEAGASQRQFGRLRTDATGRCEPMWSIREQVRGEPDPSKRTWPCDVARLRREGEVPGVRKGDGAAGPGDGTGVPRGPCASRTPATTFVGRNACTWTSHVLA